MPFNPILAGKFLGPMTGFIKDRAADGLNMLPDRINLFGRYVTGIGNRRLQLDPSTERSIYAATEETPMSYRVPGEQERKFAEIAGFDLPERVPSGPILGPGVPTSGKKAPYNTPIDVQGVVTGTPDYGVTNTLGRFEAFVTPGNINIRDTYDLENEIEDPDLVSGKFQPVKAIRTLRSAMDGQLDFDPFSGQIRRRVANQFNTGRENRGYRNNSGSSTHSFMTQLGRSLLYALPYKPTPYDIDYNIPRR
tara:strand:+ start:114 stop:863 length:750 start_codon:yes stop_codon:yes gene_type:complete